MTVIVGPKSYLYCGKEAVAWGTNAASKFLLPVYDYGVQFEVDSPRQPTPYLGLYQRKISRRSRGMPKGSLVAPLSGVIPTGGSVSIAEFLMDWGMIDKSGTAPELRDLTACTCDWAEGPDDANARHLGMRVNQATLEGSESNQILQVTLDLMGKDEEALVSATAIPDDMHGLPDMDFSDLIFKIDDGTGEYSPEVITIDSFSLSVANNLMVRYNNSDRPSLLMKMDREVLLTVTLDKEDDTYDVMRRAVGGADQEIDFVVQLKLVGYNGTNFTIGQLDIPMARLITKTDSRSRDAIFQEPLEFICLKPDTAENDMKIAWSTAGTKPTS